MIVFRGNVFRMKSGSRIENQINMAQYLEQSKNLPPLPAIRHTIPGWFRHIIEIPEEDITQLVLMVKKDIDAFVNRKAPDFCLPDAGGKEVCLSAFQGKWVVLYFYPKDNTPGCTLEAVRFSAALEQFAALGAQVIGVSGDTPDSHQRFAEKHNLTVVLLSDTDHRVLKAYDAWKPKIMFGKEVLGTERDTFLISPVGTIVEVWRKVRVKGHAEEVKVSLESRGRG